MISEDDLRRLLAVTAASAEPPEDGAERILLARTSTETRRRSIRRRPGRQSRTGSSADRTGWRQPRWAIAGLALVAVVIGGGVGVGQLSAPEDSSSTTSALPRPAPQDAGGDGAAADSGAAGEVAPDRAAAPSTTTVPLPGRPSGLPSTDARIVQNGQITLQVDPDKVPDAVDRLGAIAIGLRGYVASSSTTDSSSPSGTVTLRVPAAAYPQVLAQTRGLGRVLRSSSDSRDVTGEVVDLAARIKTLQDTRASYQALLARAGTVDEILEVQQQISDVQSEIEQLQGRAQVLEDQSDFATVAVTVTTPSRSSSLIDEDDDGIGGAWDRAVSGFADGVEWLVAASGPVLFLVLLALVLAWPVRWGIRYLRRRAL